MGLYCNAPDVLRIATRFSVDVASEALPDERVDDAIAEAESMVNAVLQVRYDIALIQASVPPIVKDFCATLAAKTLFMRYSFAASDEGDTLGSRFRAKISHYIKIITNGGLLDSSGATVQSRLGPSSTTFVEPSNLEEVFANGSRKL